MMYNNGSMSGAASTATGALSVDGRQPVWMTLNEARERAFTGEVVFEVDPEVFAYFDNGVVYFAERTTDASLGERLLDAGVVDHEQLARGTVRVGDVQHLGRLFEREDGVDRDAVLVVTETSTEELIAELANREIASVRVTAYRHHPSGIHRWFVAPHDQVGAPRPVSEIPQVGTSVVDDLPGLTILDEDLLIEWDEPLDDVETESPFAVDEFDLDVDAAFAADLLLLEDRGDVFDTIDFDDVDLGEEDLVAIEVDEEPVEPAVDEVAVDEVAVDEVAVDEVAVDETDEMVVDEIAEMYVVEADPDRESVVATADGATDFAVVWPDGTEQAVESGDASDADASDDDSVNPFDSSPLTAVPDGALRFEMPALELRQEPDVEDAEVPDEVAAAVRRAIAAIESATSEVPVITPATLPDGSAVEPPAEIVVNEPAPAFTGFAPPTMDMRAEVLYGQIEAEHAAADVDADVADVAGGEQVNLEEPALLAEPPVLDEVPGDPLLPQPGVASVVFVDEDEQQSGGEAERKSALRRLIGSLRRKDR